MNVVSCSSSFSFLSISLTVSLCFALQPFVLCLTTVVSNLSIFNFIFDSCE